MLSLLYPTATAARRFRTGWPGYGIAVVLFVALSLTTSDFLRSGNIVNLFNQQAALTNVAIGQTFVLIAAGLDISVGAVMSLTTAILSLDLPAVVSIPLAFAAAALVGLCNGVGVTVFRIHPILMTLSSMTVVQGVTLLLRPVPGGRVPAVVTVMANATVGGLPVPVILTVVVVGVGILILNRTTFGLHVLAVGASPDNARLGGVPVNRVLLGCYVLASLFAAVAGFHLAGRIGSGDPLVGDTFSVDSIAAAALGGTLLAGGIGSIAGTVGGVALLALLANGLNLLDVSPFYQIVIKGLLLVLVVCAHRRNEAGL